MPKAIPSSTTPRNRILSLLPAADYQRLQAHLHPVELPFKQVLYKARANIDYIYFPEAGLASALAIMANGSAIEVATIGYEGMLGIAALFGAGESPNEVLIQVAGVGLRIEAAALRQELQQSGALHQLLMRYHSAYMVQVSQSVACNGLHIVRQRCCRWLLISHDRVEGDAIPLTHEFLAIMLGVRRPSVTEVLGPLQDEGLIRVSRGIITVRDRAGLEAAACECYRTVQDEFDRLLGAPDSKPQ